MRLGKSAYRNEGGQSPARKWEPAGIRRRRRKSERPVGRSPGQTTALQDVDTWLPPALRAPAHSQPLSDSEIRIVRHRAEPVCQASRGQTPARCAGAYIVSNDESSTFLHGRGGFGDSAVPRFSAQTIGCNSVSSAWAAEGETTSSSTTSWIQDCRIVAVCDVNQAARERAVALIQKANGAQPKDYLDMREVFASKEVDAVSLPLPNHWHALATIWACQAGKDVYVEKPASHNVWEGLQMVAAARKYKRMVQVGSQSRTTAHKMKAIQLLRDGILGQVVQARGLCFRRRFSIGTTPAEPVPAGVDWDRFLGPAPMQPFSKNRYAYNWHWFWDTGNGDVGNQGVHEMDVALWGLGKSEWPQATMSTGGKFAWADDQETPNMLATTFEFADAMMTFDVRNLPTPPEGAVCRAASTTPGTSSSATRDTWFSTPPGSRSTRAW